MPGILELIIGGLVAGLIFGALIPDFRSGCLLLVAVPVVMIGYAAWWVAWHPEVKSQDAMWALVYVFVPLWPSIGAICGFFLAHVVRDQIRGK